MLQARSYCHIVYQSRLGCSYCFFAWHTWLQVIAVTALLLVRADLSAVNAFLLDRGDLVAVTAFYLADETWSQLLPFPFDKADLVAGVQESLMWPISQIPDTRVPLNNSSHRSSPECGHFCSYLFSASVLPVGVNISECGIFTFL